MRQYPVPHARLHTVLPFVPPWSTSFQALEPADSLTLHLPIPNPEHIQDFCIALTSRWPTKGLVQNAKGFVSGTNKKERKGGKKKEKTKKTQTA